MSDHIQVLLDPSVAARLKHYHGVDGHNRIRLFEATVPTPGFGDNLQSLQQQRQQQRGSNSADATTTTPTTFSNSFDDFLDIQEIPAWKKQQQQQTPPPPRVAVDGVPLFNQRKGHPSTNHNTYQNNQLFGIQGTYAPDLITTLGGDGLLKHAGMMFQGPVPPIACVAGENMGFLTPFHISEMVEAVVIALDMTMKYS